MLVLQNTATPVTNHDMNKRHDANETNEDKPTFNSSFNPTERRRFELHAFNLTIPRTQNHNGMEQVLFDRWMPNNGQDHPLLHYAETPHWTVRNAP